MSALNSNPNYRNTNGKHVPHLRPARTTHWVPTEMLQVANWNHPDRSSEDNPKIVELAKSMAKIGQLMPIHAKWGDTSKTWLQIVEGHGRTAAAKLAKIPVVETIIDEAGMNDATVFQVITDINRKPNGAERLWGFLRDPNVVTPYMATAMTNMVRVIGRKLAHKMADSGYGYSLYKNYVLRVCEYVGDLSPQFVKRVVTWMIDKKQAHAARHWIEQKKCPAALLRSVLFRKNLCDC